MDISDKKITTLLESRSEQALKLLSEKYGGLCSSISYNVLGNRSDSEEVTNDTYMKVWNTIPPENHAVFVLMWLKSFATFPSTSFVITLAPSAVAKPMHCCQSLKSVFPQRTTPKNRQKTMSLYPSSTHY